MCPDCNSAPIFRQDTRLDGVNPFDFVDTLADAIPEILATGVAETLIDKRHEYRKGISLLNDLLNENTFAKAPALFQRARLLRIRALLSTDDKPKAVKEIGEILQSEPANCKTALVAGEVYSQTGDKEKAKRWLTESLRLCSLYSPGFATLTRADQADLLVALSQLLRTAFDEQRLSYSYAMRAVELAPENVEVLKNAGRANLNVAEFRAAEAFLDQAVRLDPRDPWLRYLRAQALIAADQWIQAMANASLAIIRLPAQEQFREVRAWIWIHFAYSAASKPGIRALAPTFARLALHDLHVSPPEHTNLAYAHISLLKGDSYDAIKWAQHLSREGCESLFEPEAIIISALAHRRLQYLDESSNEIEKAFHLKESIEEWGSGKSAFRYYSEGRMIPMVSSSAIKQMHAAQLSK